ncbi:hypothetical protein COP2_030028 [Malus domestica]
MLVAKKRCTWYLHRSADVTDEMLKRSVTFGSSQHGAFNFPRLQSSGSWPFKLLSVACLSLAAKMGEPKVQFILDL